MAKNSRTKRPINLGQSSPEPIDESPVTSSVPQLDENFGSTKSMNVETSTAQDTSAVKKKEVTPTVRNFVSKFNDVGITPLLVIFRSMNINSPQFALLNMFLRAPILKALPSDMISAELVALGCSAGMTDGLLSVLHDSTWASDNLKRNAVFAVRDVINSKISTIASSTSNLTQFCRLLGFSKFDELREGLAHDNPEATVLRAMKGILNQTIEIQPDVLSNPLWDSIIVSIDTISITRSNALKNTLTSLFSTIHYRGKKGKANDR